MIVNKTAIAALNAFINEEDLSSNVKDVLIDIFCKIDDTDDISKIIISLLGLIDITNLQQIREIVNNEDLIKLTLVNTFI